MTELGGLLAGRFDGTTVTVAAAVPARGAVGTARSFTFTRQAWEDVTAELAARHPDLDLVGWYHSHPGLGLHLSDHDRYITSTFFPQPWHLAYVVDPHRGASAAYARGGTELVMSEGVTAESHDRPVAGQAHDRSVAGGTYDRRLVVAGAAALVAVALFVAGFLSHHSSPGDRVTYTTAFDGGAISMKATVSERGTVADLTETFAETGTGRTLNGTVSPCLPAGVLLGSYKNLEIEAPDGCLLDLTAKHPSASVTGSGPVATVLAGVGPTSFRAAAPPKR